MEAAATLFAGHAKRIIQRRSIGADCPAHPARPAFLQPYDDSGDGERRNGQAHEGDDDAAGKTGDPPGMQWKLNLQEEIARRAMPRNAIAKEAAVFSIEIELRRTDSGCAIFVS